MCVLTVSYVAVSLFVPVVWGRNFISTCFMLASLLLPLIYLYLCLDLHGLGLCYLSPCYRESARCLVAAHSVTFTDFWATMLNESVSALSGNLSRLL